MSAGCPTGVTISPSTGPFTPGQVLTCSADGTATLTYEWTNSNGDVVSFTSTVSLPSSGAFTYTCTATGNLTGNCSVSGSVSGTTDSKCRKQHNAVVEILMQRSIHHSVTILLCMIINTTYSLIEIHYYRKSRLVKKLDEGLSPDFEHLQGTASYRLCDSFDGLHEGILWSGSAQPTRPHLQLSSGFLCWSLTLHIFF